MTDQTNFPVDEDDETAAAPVFPLLPEPVDPGFSQGLSSHLGLLPSPASVDPGFSRSPFPDFNLQALPASSNLNDAAQAGWPFQTGLVLLSSRYQPTMSEANLVQPAAAARLGLLSPPPPIGGVLGQGVDPQALSATDSGLGSPRAPQSFDLSSTPSPPFFKSPSVSSNWASTGAFDPSFQAGSAAQAWSNPQAPFPLTGSPASSRLSVPTPSYLNGQNDEAVGNAGQGPTVIEPAAEQQTPQTNSFATGPDASPSQMGQAANNSDNGSSIAATSRIQTPGTQVGNGGSSGQSDDANAANADTLTDVAATLSARDKDYLDRYYGPVAAYSAKYKVNPMLVLGLAMESQFASKGAYERTGDAFGMTGGSTRHMTHAGSPEENVKKLFDTFGSQIYGAGDNLQTFTNGLEGLDASGKPVQGWRKYNSEHAESWRAMVGRGFQQMQRDMPLYGPQAARQARRPS